MSACAISSATAAPSCRCRLDGPWTCQIHPLVQQLLPFGGDDDVPYPRWPDQHAEHREQSRRCVEVAGLPTDDTLRRHRKTSLTRRANGLPTPTRPLKGQRYLGNAAPDPHSGRTAGRNEHLTHSGVGRVGRRYSESRNRASLFVPLLPVTRCGDRCRREASSRRERLVPAAFATRSVASRRSREIGVGKASTLVRTTVAYRFGRVFHVERLCS
jgi:hypothetical protein